MTQKASSSVFIFNYSRMFGYSPSWKEKNGINWPHYLYAIPRRVSVLILTLHK